MYELCMMSAGPRVAPMYRAGECLLSMGEKERALQAFEEAFDLGRSSSDHRDMQDMASKRIQQLRG
jgi:predicted negative regulator of RcsB-dependent stress response